MKSIRAGKHAIVTRDLKTVILFSPFSYLNTLFAEMRELISEEQALTFLPLVSLFRNDKGRKEMKKLCLCFGVLGALIVLVGCPELLEKSGDEIPEGFALVQGGSFMMGDEFGDIVGDFLGVCVPVHEVTLTYDFWIGENPVTFDEYDAFCEATEREKPDDEGWGRGTRPVIWVSWLDAIAYCNWLSENEELPIAYDEDGNLLDASGSITTDITKVVGYRLPTEAEWEYAARGGQHHSTYKYSGSNDVEDVAWYWRNSGDEYLIGDWDRDMIAANNGRTRPVGTKLPNELGVYDMNGNVFEWCSDWYYDYTETTRTDPYNAIPGPGHVIRGGSWYGLPVQVRVAYRSYIPLPIMGSNGGFRVVRKVP